MKIRDMFSKKIERPISGVVKIGEIEESKVYQELDEYVVTREIAKHLGKFYENYSKSINGNTDRMGVWISGFFGSGKSHFLKILSYLLDNKSIEGKNAIDFFKDKVKDPMLYAEMQRASKVKTETILFNIDSKNPINNKSKEDAILRIFIKVFNEHRGLCAEIPGVAYMEEQLIKDGDYERFKEAFYEIRGKEWISRRNAFLLDKDYVAEAISKTVGTSLENAKEYVNKGVNEYEIDIAQFCKQVKDYIDSKGEDFHLIFLVDEIGQYIGSNNTLMLNLQTVAEDLSIYCKGKVWVMVTSQESIDSMIKVKGDDFSKIQGRFDTRLSLSSISVDEVIKKRILDKKENGILLLKNLYREKSAILKNLINFEGARKDLLGYSDENEFIEVYPFIPYQFKVLQSVFEQVRKHGSSGKHLSEGERSMLSAFKESAFKYADMQEGTLIPLYPFYDTIEEFLNPSISRVIERATANPALKDDQINIQVLKILFMIKYLNDEIPSNIENLATLMVSNIYEDKLELKEKIKVALRNLQSENLIQKNGDSYVFLTDDEQDVNREIKDEKIEEEKIKEWLSKDVFQRIYEDSKYKYDKNYFFQFNKIMDEKSYGNQTYNIGINILTPLSDNYYKTDGELAVMSQLDKQIIIKLGGSDEYIEEITESLKIKSYEKKKNINTLPDNIQAIIATKRGEARLREGRAKESLEKAIMTSNFYINGDKVDIKGNSPKEKINNAFNKLVVNVFKYLGYVKNNLSSESEIIVLLKNDVEQLGFDAVEQYNNEQAEKEIFDFICLQEENHQQVRMKILLNRFSDVPYGWNFIDISGITAKLIKEQKIKAKLNGEYLEVEQPIKLVDALTKLSEVDKVIINKKIKVDQSLIRDVKNVCLDVWGSISLPDDEDGMAKVIKDKIKEKIEECKSYVLKYEGKKYPGKTLFEKGIKDFNQILENRDNLSLFTALKNKGDELYDWSYDVALPISFFESQKDIFDKGLSIAEKCEENKYYLSDVTKEKVNKLNDILNDPIPYSKIRNIMDFVKVIEDDLNKVVEEKRMEVLSKVKNDFDYIKLKSQQYGVEHGTPNIVDNFYEALLVETKSYTDVYKLDAVVTRSSNKRNYFETLISNEIESYNRKRKEEEGNGEVNEPINPTPKPETRKVEKVAVSKLLEIKLLRSEEDIEIYLRELKNKLISIIKEDKEIEIE